MTDDDAVRDDGIGPDLEEEVVLPKAAGLGEEEELGEEGEKLPEDDDDEIDVDETV